MPKQQLTKKKIYTNKLANHPGDFCNTLIDYARKLIGIGNGQIDPNDPTRLLSNRKLTTSELAQIKGFREGLAMSVTYKI